MALQTYCLCLTKSVLKKNKTFMSNTAQYCFLCTVIFTNLLFLSNNLATINHRNVKNLYKKNSLTKCKKVSYLPNPPPPPHTELPLNKSHWATVPPDN